MYLTAGSSWQNDKNKRAVCLRSENSRNTQQWKIEPAQKI
jgi:hypothetical protein